MQYLITPGNSRNYSKIVTKKCNRQLRNRQSHCIRTDGRCSAVRDETGSQHFGDVT